MLFITSRLPVDNQEPALNTDFVFDLSNNASSRAFFCCVRHKAGKYQELGSLALLSRIKAARYRQVLLYIHGFSNEPEGIFAVAQELQTFCNARKRQEVLVVPVIWPCDTDAGVVKDYWDDQKAADQSAYALERMFQKFMAWRASCEHNPEDDPCLKRINVLAHSMGNRVLRETLANWRRYDQCHGLPLLFRNSFLVAADIVNDALHRGQVGELISECSRNVVVYYASDDLALRASKLANLRNAEASRRLGHTGPEDMELTPKNVYAVDCDEVNTLYDYPKGHSYFRAGTRHNRPGVVFEHIFNCMLTGRVFPGEESRRSAILDLAAAS